VVYVGVCCRCPAVYVGTYIGERLLYFPSIGALLLAAEAAFPLLLARMLGVDVKAGVGARGTEDRYSMCRDQESGDGQTRTSCHRLLEYC
jgi:hypothetical protein